MTTDPTPRLRAIQEREAKATKGPWFEGETDIAWLLAELARLTQERDAHADEKGCGSCGHGSCCPQSECAYAHLIAKAITERDEARREHETLNEHLDELDIANRNHGDYIARLESKLKRAEAERETLRGYVQHKPECETKLSTNELIGVCTCGLASCLTPSTPKEP